MICNDSIFWLLK